MKKTYSYWLVTLFTLFIFLSSCQQATDKKTAEQPPEVEIALPLKKKIIEWDEYTGRFQALKTIDIRSRVTGYLDAIKFKDGDIVKKGDVLFIIDPRPFQYALKRVQAQYNLAKRQYARASKLVKQKFISEEIVDQRLQQLQAAEANLHDAELNLEFTSITAPITGKISRHFVSIGNLIRMNDTILTRIVSVDPIYFYFEASQNDLLKYIRLNHVNLKAGSEKSPYPIRLQLPDEKGFNHLGKIDFVDNIVEQGTGTILARAIIPNPKQLFYPGFFGRARIAGSEEYIAVLIPDTAINTDQNYQFVYVVDKNNEVKRVAVETGPIRDSGFYIIRKGLKGDEHVVINGIQRIRHPGQKVTPIMTQLVE